MGQTLDLVRPLVDKTLDGLSKRKFKADPLLGPEYSRKTSLAASAQRRHGHIIEASLICRLGLVDHFEVWGDPKFVVSAVADNMVNAATAPESLIAANAPYEAGKRTLQVDVFVFNKKTGHLSSYEVKRGNDHHDSGKKRSMLRDLMCVQVLMKSYAEQIKSLNVELAESRIIFYYGACSIGKPFSLTKGELDDHFGVPIVSDLEEVSSYFQHGLMGLLEAG